MPRLSRNWVCQQMLYVLELTNAMDKVDIGSSCIMTARSQGLYYSNELASYLNENDT
jgi:hypothetical protein